MDLQEAAGVVEATLTASCTVAGHASCEHGSDARRVVDSLSAKGWGPSIVAQAEQATGYLIVHTCPDCRMAVAFGDQPIVTTTAAANTCEHPCHQGVDMHPKMVPVGSLRIVGP